MAENPDGCTQCFCSGLSTDCISSRLFRDFEQTVFVVPLNDPYMGWYVSDQNGLQQTRAGLFVISNPSTSLNQLEGSSVTVTIVQHPVYFLLPEKFRGNKLTSYGGYFQYTIWFTVRRLGGTIVGSFTNDPDLILIGNGRRAYHYLSSIPVEGQLESISVPIVESSFVNETGGKLMRDELMSIIGDISVLMVRATYYNETEEFAIANFTMDTATVNGGGRIVETVEECQCPVAYSGLSCESCADSFTRFGALLGTCTPCSCNNHASSCDEMIGVCTGCQNNTFGDFCEYCQPGYYGNATQGTDSDCVACPCSSPQSSSSECSLGVNGPICNCSVGYQGQLCDECEPNYFGGPKSPGGVCSQCDCNGNIDTSNPTSCNRTTGICYNCLHNTDGSFCERCADGYYGDATTQSCQGQILASTSVFMDL